MFIPERLLVVATLLCTLPQWTLAITSSAACPSGQYSVSSTQPATRFCSSFGRLTRPNPLGSARTVSDINDCVAACLGAANGSCLTFGYTAKNTSCQLYGSRLIDQGYKQRSTDLGTVFSNVHCYRCKPLACSSDQALYNSGFGNPDPNNSTMPDGWAFENSDPTHLNYFYYRNPGADFMAFLENTRNPGQVTGSITATQVLQCVDVGVPYTLSGYTVFSPVAEGNVNEIVYYLDGKEIGRASSKDSNTKSIVIPRSQTPTFTAVWTASVANDPANLGADLRWEAQWLTRTIPTS